jgi:hypothetical protein
LAKERERERERERDFLGREMAYLLDRIECERTGRNQTEKKRNGNEIKVCTPRHHTHKRKE